MHKNSKVYACNNYAYSLSAIYIMNIVQYRNIKSHLTNIKERIFHFYGNVFLLFKSKSIYSSASDVDDGVLVTFWVNSSTVSPYVSAVSWTTFIKMI